MILILQIAAGIVLGVVIVVYHRNLLAIAKVILGLLLFVIFIGLLIWGGTAASEAITPHYGKIYEGLRTFVGGMLGIFSFLAGAYGLWLLLAVLSNFSVDKITDTRFGLMCVANVVLVASVGWVLSSFTPIGALTVAVDSWSRDAGYKDLGSMLLFCVALLWAYIPLGLMAWSRALKQRRTPDDAKPE